MSGLVRLAACGVTVTRGCRQKGCPAGSGSVSKTSAGRKSLRAASPLAAAFARAIEASYEQTADCPGLVGLRRIEDIIAGHMAAGQFVPELWLALRRRGEPVGVMLVNELTQGAGFELVYLGIAAPYRGQGLARSLLAYGLGQASVRGRANWGTDNPRLHLAVDEANPAARQLYARFGFRASTRKLAMIRALT